MLNNVKALVVVLALALLVFRIGRPICLRFMSEEAFARRRNAWLGLTVLAFVSPTFWLFALCELLVLLWLNNKDENPLALFAIVTFTIPNVKFYIPVPLVNQLFDLSQYRILALAVLIPAVIRIIKRPDQWSSSRFGIIDGLMLGFILVQLAIPMPYESVTNTLRRGFLLLLDTYLVVYAFQRVASKQQLGEVLACFWLSTAIMAPIAVFEAAKGWLLYTGLSDLWGDPNVFSYLYRGGALRAQVAAGHSINLGYQLAAGLGTFLFLWRPSVPRRVGWTVMAVFSLALIATGSRGAWVTALIAVIVFIGFRPNAGRRLASAAGISVVLLALIYLSPLKESVIDRLPIIGTADQETITYRQQLFDVSWQLIKQNPFFGDPFVVERMESLRQGQGIIDIVNGYLFVALFYGLVALFFVVGSFLWASARTMAGLLAARKMDEETATLGVVLFAVFMATMFYIGTGGIITTHYLFLGLLCAYSKIVDRARATVASQSFRRHNTAFNVPKNGLSPR